MTNRKILLNENELMAINTRSAMQLLTDCLGVLKRNHPNYDNMVLIGGKSWWVITETATDSIDIEKATLEHPFTLFTTIREVRSGLLILRQMGNHRITLHFISDLDALENQLQLNSALNWSEIEKLQIFSDTGAQTETGECIGFEMFKSRWHEQDRLLISPTEV